MTKTLFILYNADASILGKLKYSYRKLTTPKDCTPACAACDLTHGGLHLDETAEWKRVKAEIARSGSGGGGGGMEVKQLHRDEFGGEMKKFIGEAKLAFPMVLLERSHEEGGSGYDVIMEKEELGSFGGSAEGFLEGLQKKGVLSASSAASSL